jgi:hypothetical protein
VPRWFADETYLKVAGAWTYLYRAVDQHGQVNEVLLSARRDLGGRAAIMIAGGDLDGHAGPAAPDPVRAAPPV